MTQEELKSLENLLSKLANLTMDYRNSYNEHCFSQVRDLMKKVKPKTELGNIERNFQEDMINDMYDDIDLYPYD